MPGGYRRPPPPRYQRRALLSAERRTVEEVASEPHRPTGRSRNGLGAPASFCDPVGYCRQDHMTVSPWQLRGGSRKSLRVVLLVGKPTCRELRGGIPRKRRSLGGSGGMAPENFWKYGCSEVQFGAFVSRNRIATGLTISQTTLSLHIALLLHCTWLFSSPTGD